MKIITWNIRNRNEGDARAGYGWDAVRFPRMRALIETLAPDILAVQEALWPQMKDLRAALPDYQDIGVGRDDGREAGEFAALFARRARYEVRDWRTRWLSQTPDVPSIGWDADLPRIATCARLFDHELRREFEVWNTHFDHKGEAARLQSARYLRRELAQLSVPALLCGDFNAAPDDAPIVELLQGETLRDARALSPSAPTGELATFCGFDREPLTGISHRIDYVFATTGWQIESYDVPAFPAPEFPPPSDHRPVAVVARLLP